MGIVDALRLNEAILTRSAQAAVRLPRPGGPGSEGVPLDQARCVDGRWNTLAAAALRDEVGRIDVRGATAGERRAEPERSPKTWMPDKGPIEPAKGGQEVVAFLKKALGLEAGPDVGREAQVLMAALPPGIGPTIGWERP